MLRRRTAALMAELGVVAALGIVGPAEGATSRHLDCPDLDPRAGRLVVLDGAKRVRPFGGVTDLLRPCSDGGSLFTGFTFIQPSDSDLSTVTARRGSLVRGRATSRFAKILVVLRSRPTSGATRRLETRQEPFGVGHAWSARLPRRWRQRSYLSVFVTYRRAGYRKEAFGIVRVRLR